MRRSLHDRLATLGGSILIEALEGQGGALVTIENHPFTAVPGHPAVVSTSKKLKITDHGISLDISGKNGFYSAFAYQS